MANLRVDKITSTETFEKTGSVQFFDPQTTRTSIPDSATLQLGSADFTMECWRLQHTDPGNAYAYAAKYASTGNASFWFGSINTYRESFFWYDGTIEISIISNVGSSRVGQWDHIAASREGNIFRLFINGKLVGSKSSAVTLHDDSNDLTVGSDSYTNKNELNGFLSNVRIIKGKAIYTTNFKPPMRELEVTAETVLLACQSKTDASLEKTGKVITVGDAVASELTPGLLTPVVKSGGGSAITGSVEFDGSGDYLSVPSSNNDFYFEDHKFTIECWAYTGLDTTSNHSLLAQWGSGADRNIQFDYRGDASKVWRFYYRTSSTTEFVSGNEPVEPNSWYHLAVVADGTNLKLFVNGVLEDTNAIAGDAQNSTANLYIGSYQGTLQYYNGFISNFRIVRGTALYTDSFTPPTRELKRVPGTVLLCCQDSNDPTQEVTGKTISLNGLFTYDTVVNSGITTAPGPSNFTPQVGDDRQVTFEGVTKINTDAYFCLPTGNTESRDKGAGTRGISFAGSDASNKINTISHINISTTGNAKDFGDLLDKITELASAASSTRGISAGGVGTSPTANEIDTVNYITMASTGDALDFGDLTVARRLLVGCSSQTRGIFAGGYDAPNKYNTMDYITIASTGDAIDFGDMVADGQTASGRYGSAGYASPTRGVWHGGYGYPAYRNIIDYVTISSKGNTKDFGDSAIKNYYMGGCSNSIRGISGGAFNPGPATHINYIEYTTIATTGDAKDFGDLIQRDSSTGACASKIRGVFLGGIVGGSKTNNISYVTLMSMGNALDFGDLTTVTGFNAGCSNGHGGLG